MNSKKNNWRKYAYEFLSIFIAVTSAFALNHWNVERRDAISQDKILNEIKNGIKLDHADFETNKKGNLLSKRAGQAFRELLDGKPLNKDSVQIYYILLFRDYTPIINQSGYESLKSNGLETIKNDALRFDIISLYGFYYAIIAKLEDEVIEMRSYANYYQSFNNLLAKYMIFSDNGTLTGINPPIDLSQENKNKLLSYIWRIESNRNYKLGKYNLIQGKMQELIIKIDEELEHR